MHYKILKVGDEELKLRLRSRDCVDLEKTLGESPLNILMKVEDGKIPSVGFIITTLQYSLQALEHGYNLGKTFDLYDKYIENGGDMMEMFQILVDVFEVSGFFKKEKIEKEAQAQEIENTQENQIVV